MLTMQDLRYFQVVGRSESLRKAAETLHLSQPALSHSMRRLEEHFGLPLLIRRRSGVQLSPAGRNLLSRVAPLVESWETLGPDLLAADHELRGRIRLGCHASVAQYTLSGFLPQLLRDYPQLEITLSHSLSREVADQVNQGDIDVGIAVNPPPLPDLVVRPLCQDEVTFWRVRRCNEDVLIFEPALAQTQWLLRHIPKRKRRQFTRTIESSNLEVVRELVATGAGIGILPTRVAANQRRRLHPVDGLGGPYVDDVCLIFRPGFTATVQGRTIVDAILATKLED
jgi:DNA-binding transcriptional LysR family regulator